MAHAPTTTPTAARPIDPRVDIGHVELKVADLDRALGFYRDVLGFEVTQRWADRAAMVSAGGYHHHLGLNATTSAGGAPPPPGTTGLHHVAIRYPTRATLADALRRVRDAGIELTGATDFGIAEAVYVVDPDGHAVELTWDRPREDWPPRREGDPPVTETAPLDTDGLLALAPPEPGRPA